MYIVSIDIFQWRQAIPYNKAGDKPEIFEMEQLVKRWLGGWISQILTRNVAFKSDT